MISIRRVVLATLAAAMLTAPLTATSTPAGAEPVASAAAKDYKPWGKASSPNRVLKPGCNTYSFRYRVTIPEEGRDDWAAEFFIRKPNGRALASPVAIIGSDPLRGRKTYRACRANNTYGSYKIAMKVTWTDDGRGDHEGFVRPTRFRFTR